MRVMHVMEATIGGTRRHIVDVVRGQLRRGLTVDLVASTLRQPDFEADLASLERDGARVVRLPMVRAVSPALDLAHARALARLLEGARPDLVHTHSSKAGVLGRAASLATGIAARVHTPHTFAFLFDAMFSSSKRRFFRDVERFLAGHTQAVVAVSAGEARTIERSRVVDPERLRTVPNGIDPAPFLAARALPRAGLGVPEGAPLAAVVGLLNVAKGQDLALDALVEPGLERLHLLLAGHGELEAALRARARALGVEDRVRFLGYRRDVPALLAACDLVLVPSRWEGLPYVALEAMACARPVVATPVDGARDLLGDGAAGALAESVDARAIARACAGVLEAGPGRRAELGRAGRERMLARHTAERMVDGLIAVYREVLAA